LKFAVLGAGAAGQGIAGYLALEGHKINLYNREEEKHLIEPIVKSKTLEVSGVKQGLATLENASYHSSDLKDIVQDVDCVLVAARAFGHEPLIESCLPYLEENALIVVFTGYWAAFRLQPLLSRFNRTDITVAEMTLLPLACQMLGPGHVEISGKKSKMRIAGYPKSRAVRVYETLKPVLPQLFLGDTVLETSLENYNPIMHVPIALFNLGQLEKKMKTFKFYHEGISPRVANVIDAVDSERMSLIKMFNLDLMSARDMVSDYYETEGTSTYEIIKNWKAVKEYVLPNPLSYVREELLYGLVTTASLCDLLGIPAEATRTLIASWSTVDGVNYWQRGVKVDKLGVEGMSKDEIIALAAR
jgi:opine dehydrogenase